jgi:hypothetical protein
MILQKIMFAFRAWTAILALWRLIIPRPFGAYNSATGQNRLLHALNTKISVWIKTTKAVATYSDFYFVDFVVRDSIKPVVKFVSHERLWLSLFNKASKVAVKLVEM